MVIQFHRSVRYGTRFLSTVVTDYGCASDAFIVHHRVVYLHTSYRRKTISIARRTNHFCSSGLRLSIWLSHRIPERRIQRPYGGLPLDCALYFEMPRFLL